MGSRNSFLTFEEYLKENYKGLYERCLAKAEKEGIAAKEWLRINIGKYMNGKKVQRLKKEYPDLLDNEELEQKVNEFAGRCEQNDDAITILQQYDKIRGLISNPEEEAKALLSIAKKLCEMQGIKSNYTAKEVRYFIRKLNLGVLKRPCRPSDLDKEKFEWLEIFDDDSVLGYALTERYILRQLQIVKTYAQAKRIVDDLKDKVK